VTVAGTQGCVKLHVGVLLIAAVALHCTRKKEGPAGNTVRADAREDNVQRDLYCTFDEGIELCERGRPQTNVRLP